mmetsp:Transcript_25410/g.40169  ORF Transcript_25410/g.40169 Transcript_25410/m.40169 type:complete len:273 (+) Transcript_25410:378-1196(+)
MMPKAKQATKYTRATHLTHSWPEDTAINHKIPAVIGTLNMTMACWVIIPATNESLVEKPVKIHWQTEMPRAYPHGRYAKPGVARVDTSISTLAKGCCSSLRLTSAVETVSLLLHMNGFVEYSILTWSPRTSLTTIGYLIPLYLYVPDAPHSNATSVTATDSCILLIVEKRSRALATPSNTLKQNLANIVDTLNTTSRPMMQPCKNARTPRTQPSSQRSQGTDDNKTKQIKTAHSAHDCHPEIKRESAGSHGIGKAGARSSCTNPNAITANHQ